MINKCLRKSLKILRIKLKKATSYNVVKSRLNYRLYSPELLVNKIIYMEKN